MFLPNFGKFTKRSSMKIGRETTVLNLMRTRPFPGWRNIFCLWKWTFPHMVFLFLVPDPYLQARSLQSLQRNTITTLMRKKTKYERILQLMTDEQNQIFFAVKEAIDGDGGMFAMDAPGKTLNNESCNFIANLI